MDGQKKFSTSEIIIGGFSTLLIDVIAALLDFIPAVGWAIASLMQSATSFATTMWLKSKGSSRATKLERQMIKQLSNALPWVPTCFVSFAVEVALHNNPEKFGKLGKLAGAEK